MTYRQTTTALAATALVTASSPAFATLTATGAIDTSAALTSFVGWMMGIAGLVFICIFVFKGIQCASDGRHFAPAAMSLIGGVLLCFGGYYVLTRLGVT